MWNLWLQKKVWQQLLFTPLFCCFWIRDKHTGSATLVPDQALDLPINKCSGSIPFWDGSCTLDYGSGPGPCAFRQWLFKMPTKISFFFQIFLLITFCTFTLVKDNMSLRSHKTVLRIHEILVRYPRIRICESIPLILLFSSVTFRTSKKIIVSDPDPH